MENWVIEYEFKKQEDFLLFVQAFLKWDCLERPQLYSDAFIKQANYEIENPIDNCYIGLNCHIIPMACLNLFYSSVNSELPEELQFDFENNVTEEYYDYYETECLKDAELPVLLLDIDAITYSKSYLDMNQTDLEEYYNEYEKVLDDFVGKWNCIKFIKLRCLNNLLKYVEGAIYADNDSLYKNHEDYINLEINAIKSKINKLEETSFEPPINDYDCNMLNELNDWVLNMRDKTIFDSPFNDYECNVFYELNKWEINMFSKSSRDSIEIFCNESDKFIERAINKDSWERLLLCKLGFYYSKEYLLSKFYIAKPLSFSIDIFD